MIVYAGAHDRWILDLYYLSYPQFLIFYILVRIESGLENNRMLLFVFNQEHRNTIDVIPLNPTAYIDRGVICPVKVLALILLDSCAHL